MNTVSQPETHSPISTIARFIKRKLIYAELLATLGLIGFASYQGSVVQSFIKKDKESRRETATSMRNARGVELVRIQTIPDIASLIRDTITRDEDKFVLGEAVGEPPTTVTGVLPIVRSEFKKVIYINPKYCENVPIAGQDSEGSCALVASSIAIQYATDIKTAINEISKGIGYNNDPDGSPDISTMTRYMNQIIKNTGYKAEYVVNPNTDAMRAVVDAGGTFILNINSRGGYPHWVTVYKYELDENGDVQFFFHDSGKAFFDRNDRYIRVSQNGREGIGRIAGAGSIWRVSGPVLQEMIDYSLTGNVLGSVLRGVTNGNIKSFGIALYDTNCDIDPALAKEMFYVQRNRDDEVDALVDFATRCKRNPLEAKSLGGGMGVMALCYLIWLTIRATRRFRSKIKHTNTKDRI